MESESLPALGKAASYELRSETGVATPQGAFEVIDDAVLARVEQRLIKQMRGSGVTILHGVAVPATATTIDHLCVGENGITAIDVEREPDHRADLVARVTSETEILSAILVEGGLGSEQVAGAVCRTGRGFSRGSRTGSISVGDVKGVAKLARRARRGQPIDVQLALALLRVKLGRDDQRSHRITRPDGF